MSALWTSQDAAAATGGRVTVPWTADGVSIDTRSIEPGDLFVALTAARDGHDFVADALAKGARAALVSRVPEGVAEDAPLLIVEDVQTGLEALGRAARARTRAKVIGITGSVGKTSTKKMMHDALAGQGTIHAAEKSFNNHWGVPLTLARMPVDVDWAVIEIGMSAPGEIAPLAKMARPDAAIITTIAPAHLEAFENIDGIAHEKAAIFEGLAPGGTAIVNVDVAQAGILRDWGAKFASRTLTFGEAPEADFRLLGVESSERETKVAADANDRALAFTIGTSGRHFAANAMAVLAAVDALGGDVTRAATALSTWEPPGGRGVRKTVSLGQGASFDLIDDAFNANPASLSAALDTFLATEPLAGGKRVLVLGDMLELGPDEIALHAAIADHPVIADVATVHCVGPRMKALWNALTPEKRGHWAETAEKLEPEAPTLVDAGDVILVKGSKGSRVSLIADALSQIGTKPAQHISGGR